MQRKRKVIRDETRGNYALVSLVALLAVVTFGSFIVQNSETPLYSRQMIVSEGGSGQGGAADLTVTEIAPQSNISTGKYVRFGYIVSNIGNDALAPQNPDAQLNIQVDCLAVNPNGFKLVSGSDDINHLQTSELLDDSFVPGESFSGHCEFLMGKELGPYLVITNIHAYSYFNGEYITIHDSNTLNDYVSKTFYVNN